MQVSMCEKQRVLSSWNKHWLWNFKKYSCMLFYLLIWRITNNKGIVLCDKQNQGKNYEFRRYVNISMIIY